MDNEIFIDEIENEVIDEKESRGDRFKRVAAYRVNRVLKYIQLIENCSNKMNYEYTEEEIEKMFLAIQSAVDEAKAKFSSVKEKKPFSF